MWEVIKKSLVNTYSAEHLALYCTLESFRVQIRPDTWRKNDSLSSHHSTNLLTYLPVHLTAVCLPAIHPSVGLSPYPTVYYPSFFLSVLNKKRERERERDRERESFAVIGWYVEFFSLPNVFDKLIRSMFPLKWIHQPPFFVKFIQLAFSRILWTLSMLLFLYVYVRESILHQSLVKMPFVIACKSLNNIKYFIAFLRKSMGSGLSDP